MEGNFSQRSTQGLRPSRSRTVRGERTLSLGFVDRVRDRILADSCICMHGHVNPNQCPQAVAVQAVVFATAARRGSDHGMRVVQTLTAKEEAGDTSANTHTHDRDERLGNGLCLSLSAFAAGINKMPAIRCHCSCSSCSRRLPATRTRTCLIYQPLSLSLTPPFPAAGCCCLIRLLLVLLLVGRHYGMAHEREE